MSKIKKNVKYADILALAKEYSEKLEEVKKKQPYHLNIIEELHINENAHSRILAKLFQYKDNEGKYVFLQSLLEYINDKNGSSCDFSKINVVSPEITQEKDRIDVLVLGEKQAVIIENKICGANDQEKQLHRYVEKVKGKGYGKSDIYIVYLTKYYQSPTKNTWSSKVEEGKFKARFCNLSYMIDILQWLNDVKDKLDEKETELKSALEQYANYLQILKNEDKMEAKMKQFFENNGFSKDVDKVVETHNSLTEFNDGIVEYKRNLIVEEICKWKEEIKETDKIELYKEEPEPEYNPLVVKCKGVGSQDYFLYIKFAKPYQNLENIYCVFQVEDTKNNISETNDTVKKIKKVLQDKCKEGFNEDKHTYECTWLLSNANLKQLKETFFEVLNTIK